MKSIKLLTATLSLAAAALANATPIDFLASADGIAATPDYSFSSTGGLVVLGLKNTDVYFVGVGRTGDPEIASNESLSVNFSSLERLSSLSLALLFNGGEYGDVNEIAQAKVGSDTYQLRLTGENAAKWYKNNVFVTAVAGFETYKGGTGLFTIANPFGYNSVSSFTLKAVNHSGQGANKSDFGLFAFTTVPDAGSTLALLGGAILALAAVARRNRR